MVIIHLFIISSNFLKTFFTTLIFVLFLHCRWLKSVKRYWQHADSIIEGSSVNSEENFTRKFKGKSKVQGHKKSYRVRLGVYQNILELGNTF